MRMATHTDVINNPCYGLHKLDPGSPFFRVYKNPYCIFFCAQLLLCMLLHTTDNEMWLATIQDLTEVSECTCRCCFMHLVNVSLPLCFGAFIKM